MRNSAKGQIVAHLKETDVVKERADRAHSENCRSIMALVPRGAAVIGCCGGCGFERSRGTRKAQQNSIDDDYLAR